MRIACHEELPPEHFPCRSRSSRGAHAPDHALLAVLPAVDLVDVDLLERLCGFVAAVRRFGHGIVLPLRPGALGLAALVADRDDGRAADEQPLRRPRNAVAKRLARSG